MIVKYTGKDFTKARFSLSICCLSPVLTAPCTRNTNFKINYALVAKNIAFIHSMDLNSLAQTKKVQ